MKTCLLAFAGFLLGSCSRETPSLPDLQPDSVVPATDNPDVVAWIPRAEKGEDQGIHFKGEHPEMLRWGPKNFVIDEDGTFWIADTVPDHILHTDRGGKIMNVLDVSKEADGALVADVNEQEMAVASVASQPPRALRYTRSGDFVASYDLPMDWRGSVSGIEISDTGVITVEREEGYRRYKINVHDDDSYDLVAAPSLTWDLNEPTTFDQFEVKPVDSRNSISLRRFMGTWDGMSYIYSEEWRDDERGRAVVDSTIRMFDSNDEQVGISRVNIRDRYTFVDLGGVQYDDRSGDMLAMMTTVDGLEIVTLEFVDHLSPLPDWEGPDEESGIPNQLRSCVTWSSMDSTIGVMLMNAYFGVGVYANTSGCTSREIPSYIHGDGFFGVPYSWGDCDNDPDMASYMSSANGTNNYKAGDADGTYTSPSTCGRGTDCSGLITRAWNYSCPAGKLSTSTIATATYTTIDSGSWDSGEVYNLSGSHVVMYYGVQSGSNYYWYESTTDMNYDGVVKSTHPTSYFSGYTHRRFVNQCL